MPPARKFFQERPENVVEHPSGLPEKNRDIPEGPLDGWIAFAPRMNGNGKEIIIFTPVVSKLEGQSFIRSEDGTDFWFDSETNSSLEPLASWRPKVPCWFQSGSTLRFVKKG